MRALFAETLNLLVWSSIRSVACVYEGVMRYVFVFHDGWQTFPKRVDIWTRTNHSRGRAIARLVNHGRLPLTTLLAFIQNVSELRFRKDRVKKEMEDPAQYEWL